MIREDVVLEPLPSRLGLLASAKSSRDRALAVVARLRQNTAFALPLIAASTAAVTGAVYPSGGTSHGFPLLYLVPILLGAYYYGAAGGTLTALATSGVAALLPFSDRHPAQPLDTVGLRTGVFVLVGLISGTFVSAFTRERADHARLRSDAARGLWRALEVRDHERAAHAERVAGYARAIAQELHLPAEAVEQVREGALLHNIGRLAVPEGSSLTPLISEHVLREVAELGPLVAIIRSHHEHWDGSGSPDGLHSHEIPLEARIVTVANAYDGLTNPNHDNKPAADAIGALARLRAEAGGRFDPEVVAALERIFTRWRVILPPDFFLPGTQPAAAHAHNLPN
ncbi:MAG: HD domain-containing protein [Acidobacteriota bacterium]|nr:HD domain-containing protein [Acidobacteriota bacterium]